MSRIICYKWGCPDIPANVWWNSANWLWSECQLVDEIVTGIIGEEALPEWLAEDYDPYANRLNTQKREKFIRLLRKVKGEPNFDSKKEKKESESLAGVSS